MPSKVDSNFDFSEIFKIQNNVIKSIQEVKDVFGVSFGEELFKALDKTRDKEVMVDAATGRTWTGEELRIDIERLANGMVTAGMRVNEVIAFYTDDKFLGLNAIGFFASLVAGVTYTGGDFRYPKEEVLRLCRDTRVSYLVASESTIAIALQVAAELPQIKRLFVIDPHSSKSTDFVPRLFELPTSDVELPVRVDPVRDVAMIGFSSGTTGLPKSVLRSHQGTLAYRLLGCAPFHFSSGDNCSKIMSYVLNMRIDVLITQPSWSRCRCTT